MDGALQASEARLRIATEAAGLGVFEWHAAASEAVWENPRMYEIFGRPARKGPMTYREFWDQAVHPDDKERVLGEFAYGMRSGESVHTEFRIRRESDAECRWIECLGKWQPVTEGEPARLIGVLWDITERRRTQELLREMADSERARADELAALMDAVPAVVLIARDRECRFITGNRAAHALLRTSGDGNVSLAAQSPERSPQFTIRIGGVALPVRELPVHAAARGEETRDVEEELEFADGSKVSLQGSAVPLRDRAGKVYGAIAAFVDITARKRAEEALKDADRRKDDFLAMLAHELRNPLAPVRNAAELLKHLRPADPQIQWATEVIDRQANHLVRLVDDLLDVSRITRGTINIRKEALDLRELVVRCAETGRSIVGARGHLLQVGLPEQPVPVHGDATRLNQVLSNLLDNAAKYTDAGGTISLSLAAAAGQAVIRVRDNGIGIAPEMLPHIFEPFTQADRSLDRAQGGLGIGLSVVRRIVEKHRGQVSAASEGLGKGSEFTVFLPLTEVLPAPAPDTHPPAAPSEAYRGRRRILVVDDNPDAANAAAALLRIGGHEVTVAHEGAAALRTARTLKPEVVLLDIGLPVMDGYEVARRLRAQPETAHAALVALTGYGREADVARSKAAGMDRHLVKPVDAEALESLIRSLAPR
jgi:signal transduction histidine kinase